jgi:endogenous inhibitor of DNA gyrase (YacG/DUF329 family)
MTAEQRHCPACGTEFTWTPAAPRQRFCSTRCKHRWHDANRKRDRRAGHPSPARDDARPPAPTTLVADTTTPAAGLAATPACPHCRQPVALVAWLVPPAASVTTPPRHAATIRDNQ